MSVVAHLFGIREYSRLLALILAILFIPCAGWAKSSWMGVQVGLSEASSKEPGASQRVVFLAIHPLGPLASKVAAGDRVHEINGEQIVSVRQFVDLAGKLRPDATASLLISKKPGGKKYRVAFKPRTRPTSFNAPARCAEGMKNPPKQVQFFALDAPKGVNPVDAELRWIKAVYGCSLPGDVETSLRKLYKIARETDVRYASLLVYVFHNRDANRAAAKKPAGRQEKPRKTAPKETTQFKPAPGWSPPLRKGPPPKLPLEFKRGFELRYAACTTNYFAGDKYAARACSQIILNEKNEPRENLIKALETRGQINLTSKSNRKQSFKDFNRLIALQPQKDLHYVSRGYLHEQEKNYEAAAQDYQKAIELASRAGGYDHLRLVRMLSHNWRKTPSRKQRIRKNIDTAIQLFEKKKDWRGAGEAYLALGKHQYKEALPGRSDYGYASFQTAIKHLKRSQSHEKVIEAYEQIGRLAQLGKLRAGRDSEAEFRTTIKPYRQALAESEKIRVTSANRERIRLKRQQLFRIIVRLYDIRARISEIADPDLHEGHLKTMLADLKFMIDNRLAQVDEYVEFSRTEKRLEAWRKRR